MTSPTDPALRSLRAQIDTVDRELLTLLNRRASLSLEVGRLKAGARDVIFKPFSRGKLTEVVRTALGT